MTTIGQTVLGFWLVAALFTSEPRERAECVLFALALGAPMVVGGLIIMSRARNPTFFADDQPWWDGQHWRRR